MSQDNTSCKLNSIELFPCALIERKVRKERGEKERERERERESWGMDSEDDDQDQGSTGGGVSLSYGFVKAGAFRQPNKSSDLIDGKES